MGRGKNRGESKLTSIFRKGFDPTKVLQLTLRRGERGVTEAVNFKVRSDKVQLIYVLLGREENNDPTIFQDSIANSPQDRSVMLTNLPKCIYTSRDLLNWLLIRIKEIQAAIREYVKEIEHASWKSLRNLKEVKIFSMHHLYIIYITH